MKDALTASCCPSGSGGGGGPDTVSWGATSSDIVTPGTAELSAATKLVVCIADTTLLALTEAPDTTVIWTAPVLGFTSMMISSSLRPGT